MFFARKEFKAALMNMNEEYSTVETVACAAVDSSTLGS